MHDNLPTVAAFNDTPPATLFILKKQRVSPVGVAGPLVEHQHACEIVKVDDLAQFFGKSRREILAVRFPLWCARLPLREWPPVPPGTIAGQTLPGLPPQLPKYKRPLELIEGPCFANSD
jgi:hypothetical protein